MTGTGAAATQHSADLSWGPSPSTVVGYNVYRSTTPGGPYTKINSSLDPSTLYTDSTVQSGQTYYYVSTAVDATGDGERLFKPTSDGDSFAITGIYKIRAYPAITAVTGKSCQQTRISSERKAVVNFQLD